MHSQRPRLIAPDDPVHTLLALMANQRPADRDKTLAAIEDAIDDEGGNGELRPIPSTPLSFILDGPPSRLRDALPSTNKHAIDTRLGHLRDNIRPNPHPIITREARESAHAHGLSLTTVILGLKSAPEGTPEQIGSVPVQRVTLPGFTTDLLATRVPAPVIVALRPSNSDESPEPRELGWLVTLDPLLDPPLMRAEPPR